jgi:hypothetical protein
MLAMLLYAFVLLNTHQHTSHRRPFLKAIQHLLWVTSYLPNNLKSAIRPQYSTTLPLPLQVREVSWTPAPQATQRAPCSCELHQVAGPHNLETCFQRPTLTSTGVHMAHHSRASITPADTTSSRKGVIDACTSYGTDGADTHSWDHYCRPFRIHKQTANSQVVTEPHSSPPHSHVPRH